MLYYCSLSLMSGYRMIYVFDDFGVYGAEVLREAET